MPDAIITDGDFSSQASFLFARFTGTDGIANIQALVGQTPRVSETNYLEFKGGKTQLAPDEHIKTLWSKALGSFANSGGGVVIWGIRADRDAATGIDAVQAEEPVPDVERLAAKLREWQPPATDPPIKGVIVHPLLLPGEASAGFVVCYVPESDTKPHRSEWGKGDVKKFNIRIGDSTQECTVPILRQLFYPKVSSRIQITVTPVVDDFPLVSSYINDLRLLPLGGEPRKVFIVRATNIGKSSIKELHLAFAAGNGCFYRWYHRLANGTSARTIPYDFQTPFASVLHPSMTTEANMAYKGKPEEPNLPMRIQAYAEDTDVKVVIFEHDVLRGNAPCSREMQPD